MQDIRRTLLLLVKDDKILLAMKKRGFGAGRWNGVGGKLEPGENIQEATIRECQEEIEVTPLSFNPVAELDFYWPEKDTQEHMYVYAFICDSWEGEPVETEEMSPKWFKIKDIPYKDMWQDDEFWLPKVLKGKLVKALFNFDNQDNLVSQDIKEVKEL